LVGWLVVVRSFCKIWKPVESFYLDGCYGKGLRLDRMEESLPACENYENGDGVGWCCRRNQSDCQRLIRCRRRSSSRLLCANRPHRPTVRSFVTGHDGLAGNAGMDGDGRWWTFVRWYVVG
jgi:hypothetical protein